ncbi:S49 family peptidase, partial [Pseudomonas aeruginosa]|uniref:S49 family peptidase n=1 Tax=Pseudomonas aeruginosa TaxID=287 RepID=UPI000BC6F652
GREKFQEDLEVTHELFKNFVAHYRPQLNMDEIATGEVWLGQADAFLQALALDELHLVDIALPGLLGQVLVAGLEFVHQQLA